VPAGINEGGASFTFAASAGATTRAPPLIVASTLGRPGSRPAHPTLPVTQVPIVPSFSSRRQAPQKWSTAAAAPRVLSKKGEVDRACIGGVLIFTTCSTHAHALKNDRWRCKLIPAHQGGNRIQSVCLPIAAMVPCPLLSERLKKKSGGSMKQRFRQSGHEQG